MSLLVKSRVTEHACQTQMDLLVLLNLHQLDNPGPVPVPFLAERIEKCLDSLDSLLNAAYRIGSLE